MIGVVEVVVVKLIKCPWCGQEQPPNLYYWLARPPGEGHPQILRGRCCKMDFVLLDPQPTLDGLTASQN